MQKNLIPHRFEVLRTPPNNNKTHTGTKTKKISMRLCSFKSPFIVSIVLIGLHFLQSAYD